MLVEFRKKSIAGQEEGFEEEEEQEQQRLLMRKRCPDKAAAY